MTTRLHWLSKFFQLLNTNEISSSSVKQENRLKLCQATWTTHSHGKKFNKTLKNFANFAPFSVLFSTKKVACSLVKLSKFIFEVFILCFPAYLFSFCTISLRLGVPFRYLLANLRKIYIHDVNMMHHKLTAQIGKFVKCAGEIEFWSKLCAGNLKAFRGQLLFAG